MLLWNYVFILATFMATLHCYDKDNMLTNFGTASKNFGEVLEISNANIKIKASLLDTGKLRLVSNKAVKKFLTYRS